MASDDIRHIICYLRQHEPGADHISHAFLTEEKAHEYWAENGHNYGAETYEVLMERGGVVYLEIPEREYRKIEKTGLFAACMSSGHHIKRNGYPEPFVVAASKTGLVKKARAADPSFSYTEYSLFVDSSSAGIYLVEGYDMPAGYKKWHKYCGALVSKTLA